MKEAGKWVWSMGVVSLFLFIAVLNALGLASFDCYEMFDFEQYFMTQLANELTIMDPRYLSVKPHPFYETCLCPTPLNRYKIVRRRLVWLIGNWVPVKFETNLRPMLYRNLIPILHPNEDLVVSTNAS